MPELVHTVDFVRHAHSFMNAAQEDPNIPPFIGGRQNDVDLDGLGEREATEFGEDARRQGFVPTLIYCSPANRTLQTHWFSADAMGIDPQTATVDDRLQELEQGEWTNQSRSLYEQHAEAMKLLGSDFTPPGGESMNDVAKRIMDFLGSLAVVLDNADTSQRVLVHTHGVAIKTLLASLLGWSHDQAYKTEIANVSRTRLIRSAGKWVVDSYRPLPRIVRPEDLQPATTT